jgi:hypothetical protein
MLVISSTTLIVLIAAGMVLGTTSTCAAAEPSTSARPRLCFWDKLIYAGFLGSLLILALTGLGVMLTGRSPISGWGLMLHCTAAPAFAVFSAVLVLVWADRSRLNREDGPFAFVQRTLFWLMIISMLVVILSAVIPMTPILGTTGQHTLYETHRYSSLVLFILVVLHGAGFVVRR